MPHVGVLTRQGDWVSGSTEAKTYGKGATRSKREEKHTLPRRSRFGKDAGERFCLEDVRTLRSRIEPPCSGTWSSRTITSWRGASS
jgi:hypothetical protein